MKKIFLLAFIALTIVACERKTATDVVDANTYTIDAQGNMVEGLLKDSLLFATEIDKVLATEQAHCRLVPIFRTRKDSYGNSYSGTVNYYERYAEEGIRFQSGNSWHDNLIAGFKTIYGSEMVNVSLLNLQTKQKKYLFEKPVLIENIYYPAPIRDTLNHKPISRDYYMISCYDEDTDRNGYVNRGDLRRFYLFNTEGDRVKALIPKEYSVVGSDYDGVNDILNVYARLDSNKDGNVDANEPKHIFCIDLKKPENTVLLY